MATSPNPAKKQRVITSDRVDQTKPATIVVNKFGGLSEFCRLTGFPTSTVHGWTVSGYIPPHRKGVSTHKHILEVATENSIPLEAGDFVDKPDDAVANG